MDRDIRARRIKRIKAGHQDKAPNKISTQYLKAKDQNAKSAKLQFTTGHTTRTSSYAPAVEKIGGEVGVVRLHMEESMIISEIGPKTSHFLIYSYRSQSNGRLQYYPRK